MLSILLETEKYPMVEDALASLRDSVLVASGIAINEALYVAAFEHYRRRGVVKGRYSLREAIRRHGYPREVIELIKGLIEDLSVRVTEDYYDFEEYINVVTSYRLLPDDTRIVLTCKHYGVDTILAFDEDFKRVPWLRVMP